MRWRSTPKVPSTAPSGRSSDSSTGPCSMWSSRYAAACSSCRRARRAPGRGRRRSPRARPAGDPVAVRQPAQRVLVGHRARGRGRAEQRAAEPRPFLVGPVDEPDRDGRACPPRRSGATPRAPATTLRQPSSQPPFGTESIWPPIRTARSERPRSVHQSLPASSRSRSSGRPSSNSANQARAVFHVSVQATRWAPCSSPVSRCSSRS